jgi:hypothetical protein
MDSFSKISNEIDRLFDITSDEPNYAERVMADIEAEYKGYATVEQQRLKERDRLVKEGKDLQKSLTSIRNIRSLGVGARRVNQENSEKREKIRERIRLIKDQLALIEEEIKGSSVTSQNLVDTSLSSGLKK